MKRVDPELVAVLEAFPQDLIDLHDISGTRAAFERMAAEAGAPPAPLDGIEVREHFPSCPPPPVRVRMYRPTGLAEPLPALLWMHGGGYVLGDLDQDDASLRTMAREVGCAIVSVDYRLAPAHPFPTALEDCHAALKWVSGAAAHLQIDGARIAVGGASAGGGLAAALALLVRNRAEIAIVFQLLIYPMIDDRNVAPASATQPDTFIWSRESNRLAWQAYLGREGTSNGDMSPYAAVTRAPDLTGLPPAYIAVGELDLFLDENLAYARRLMAAGVPAELHVYPGAFHGFDGLAPQARLSQRFIADRDNALQRALFES
jgi:acetyl esterase/lipase